MPNRFLFDKMLRAACAPLLAALLLAPSGATAQRRMAPAHPRMQRPLSGQGRRMVDLPPRWAERLQKMSPEEQERFLSNNQRFQQLPPARQAQIRRRLQMWNRLTPEQRQSILQRERVWQEMSPEQQRYVRNTLLPEWKNLPPRRRQAILQRLHQLRGLDDAQREAKLKDEGFLGDLNPQDRQMLRDLSNLRVSEPETQNTP